MLEARWPLSTASLVTGLAWPSVILSFAPNNTSERLGKRSAKNGPPDLATACLCPHCGSEGVEPRQ